MSHADFLTCQTVWCLCSMIDVMCTVGNIVPLEGGTFIPLTNIHRISKFYQWKGKVPESYYQDSQLLIFIKMDCRS